MTQDPKSPPQQAVSVEQRLRQFEEAIEGCPGWLRDKLSAGQQFNCYESASNDEDDDDLDRDYLFCIGHVTSFLKIFDVEAKWRADLVEFAFKVACAARLFAAPPADNVPADGVPAGFVVAPIEPTPEMNEAGNLMDSRLKYVNATDVYRAMLTAAPKAPTAPIREPGEGVEQAFVRLCEEIGIAATAGAYLEYRSRAALSPSAGALEREVKELLALIETAHEHGDEMAIVEQAAHVRAALDARGGA